MKRKIIIISIIVLSLISFTIYALYPKAIIDDVSGLEIYTVRQNLEEKDITEQLDLEQLKKIISKSEYKRLKTSFAPYKNTDVIYEISGHYDHRPIHILLGNINIVYESSKQGGHMIINPQELLSEVTELIG